MAIAANKADLYEEEKISEEYEEYKRNRANVAAVNAMRKKELAEKANLTDYSIRKLNKDENVTTEVIGKICKVLDCTPDDIMEFIDDEQV